MIGQEHLLSLAGEQGGGLGHEIDAAKDDVVRVDAGHAAGQLKGVAADVAVADGLFPLVVVADDGQAAAEAGAQLLNGAGVVIGDLGHRDSLAIRILRSAVTAEWVIRPTEMKSGLRRGLAVA